MKARDTNVDIHRVMLLNPKGGSGKTTLATCLAGYYASRDLSTIVFDYDSQGSSTRWLRVRPPSLMPVQGVAAFRAAAGVTRSWQMRMPPGVVRAVIDTPASLRVAEVSDLVRHADSIIIPVLPSHIDIDAVSTFVEELGRLERVRSGSARVAVVANRTRANTVIFQELENFLNRLEFPFIGRLRESQNYVRAAEMGLGLHELRRVHTKQDRSQWAPLLNWLEPDLYFKSEKHCPNQPDKNVEAPADLGLRQTVLSFR